MPPAVPPAVPPALPPAVPPVLSPALSSALPSAPPIQEAPRHAEPPAPATIKGETLELRSEEEGPHLALSLLSGGAAAASRRHGWQGVRELQVVRGDGAVDGGIGAADGRGAGGQRSLKLFEGWAPSLGVEGSFSGLLSKAGDIAAAAAAAAAATSSHGPQATECAQVDGGAGQGARRGLQLSVVRRSAARGLVLATSAAAAAAVAAPARHVESHLVSPVVSPLVSPPCVAGPAIPRSLQLSEQALHRMGSAVQPLGMREVRALTLALAEAVQASDTVRASYCGEQW